MRHSGSPGLVTLAAALLAAWLTASAESVSPSRLDALRELRERGRFAALVDVARPLLAELERREGEGSAASVTVRDLLVESLWRDGKSGKEETRRLAERAVRIKERTRGPRHIELAPSLDNLGNVVLRNDDYSGARAHFERSLEIREASLGPDHPDVAETLNHLGWALYSMGEFDASRELYDRGLRIREAAFGPAHPKFASSLNNIAVLLKNLGDYAAAAPLYERALEIYDAAWAEAHPDVAATLNNYAILLKSRGDYPAARPMYERALRILEQVAGPEHPRVAVALNNLAALDGEIGDYSAATAMHNRALEIFETSPSLESRWVASTLNNLATVAADQGDRDKARALFERALALQEESLGSDHPLVARSLTNLGSLHAMTGDLATAQRRLERALKIREASLGSDHPGTASTLGSLAEVLQKRGDPARAKGLLERAVAIYEKELGSDHPDLARALNDLAALRLESGESGPALGLALRADEIGREHLRLTARTLSERQALRYASVRPAGLDLALSSLSLGADAEMTGRVWDALIRSRALVLDEMRLRHLDAAHAVDLAAELTRASERVANLLVRGPRGSGVEQYRRLLVKAREDKERAERALAEASLTFRRQERAARVGLEDVAAALPPGHALVSYVRYDRRRARSTEGTDTTGAPEPVPFYLALVLRSKKATAVPLGPAERIERLVDRWRREIAAARGILPAAARSAERRYHETGEALRRLVWDPVARRLEATDRLLIVPDGALHLVSLATLPIGEGRYLVETTLSHYLSTERDLVRPSATVGSAAEGLLVVGGPDFDRLPGAVSGETDRVAPPQVPAEGCTDFHSLRFRALPGSLGEARSVSSLWSDRAPEPERSRVRSLVGRDASEGAFKRNAPGHRILHLATHGFFVAEHCTASAAPERELGRALAPTPGDGPILSGLALTGANLRQLTDVGEGEDGVLMAEEVAAMDLSGVEWVVLSACETGLGEVQDGEGVLGLRRAFEVAGARTLVMSLWSVDDLSARGWMRRLYEGRLSGLSSAETVRQASLETLRTRRDGGESTHPYYWGAFAAVGDWR